MTPNQKYSPLIEEALLELSQQGIDCLGPALESVLNQLMLIEREKVLQAAPFERTDHRQGHANGFKDKSLQTRFGELKLSVPKARNCEFYPSCLEKGLRSERALGLAVAEMYVNGVSTRRVKRITKELCGLEISSTQVSRLSQNLDEDLEKFRKRDLREIVYLYLDATYEKVREGGVVRDVAVLTAVGVTPKGHREVLGISCRLSESEPHWRAFLEDLLERGMKGLKLIISDDHAGLKAARKAVLPSVSWQRCLFHMSQNAQHHATNLSARSEIGADLKDVYQAPSKQEALNRLKQLVSKYEKSQPKLSGWLEENCEEGLTFYEYPAAHRKKLRTNNVSERLNQEIKRRTRVARLFPNTDSCLRLVTAVVSEIHEEWVSGRKYMGEM